MCQASWVFRTFDDSRTGPPWELSLGASQHPLAQGLEACPSVGLPLQELEPVDLSLNLALAPFQREASFHGIIVVAQSLGKALQLRNAVLGDLFEPFIELFPLSLTQHRREDLDQFVRLSYLLISLREASQIGFLPIEALLFFKIDPMSNL